MHLLVSSFSALAFIADAKSACELGLLGVLPASKEKKRLLEPAHSCNG